jgi:RNA polymerase sigma-70 factor (ECF subfamily)
MEDDFRTTRWSLVVAATGDAPRAAEALATLCENYWYPIYAFVRRRSRDAEEARDLTQTYFATLLEKRFLDQADRERGKLRAFLLASVKNFLAKEQESRRTQKRRAEDPRFWVAMEEAEALYLAELPERSDPATLFERRWAHTVLDHAILRLRRERERLGKLRQFELLVGNLTGAGDRPLAAIASDLGVAKGAVKVQLHRLRKDFGQALRDEVRDTIASRADLDDEVKHLLRLLS